MVADCSRISLNELVTDFGRKPKVGLFQSLECGAKINPTALCCLLKDRNSPRDMEMTEHGFPASFALVDQQSIDSRIQGKLYRVALSGIEFAQSCIWGGDCIAHLTPRGQAGSPCADRWG
jgi:hypothetical protein